MKKTLANYQQGKAEVTDAIISVKKFATDLEMIPREEIPAAHYELLEAIDYLDRAFESFAYENIPGVEGQ